jgi:signal transduction histidine kinase
MKRIQRVALVAAAAAHDFANSLTAISGLTDEAWEACRDNPAALESLKHLKGAVAAATERLQQARRLGPSPAPRRTVIDVGALVTATVAALQGTMGPKTVLRVESPLHPIALSADREALTRVLENLIFNARDAVSLHGGTVSVSVEVSDAGSLLLRVSDDGPGMPEATRSRIFEPFFTTKTHGTGLGLASVYNTVRAHEGRVVVETELGRGTTFTVELPLRAREG